VSTFEFAGGPVAYRGAGELTRASHGEIGSRLFSVVLACAAAAGRGGAIYDVEVVHTYPHDPQASPRGLLFERAICNRDTGYEEHRAFARYGLNR